MSIGAQSGDYTVVRRHETRYLRYVPSSRVVRGRWHLSDNVRLEMTYRYGSLDRFGLVGKTQFFQTRLQLQL